MSTLRPSFHALMAVIRINYSSSQQSFFDTVLTLHCVKLKCGYYTLICQKNVTYERNEEDFCLLRHSKTLLKEENLDA